MVGNAHNQALFHVRCVPIIQYATASNAVGHPCVVSLLIIPSPNLHDILFHLNINQASCHSKHEQKLPLPTPTMTAAESCFPTITYIMYIPSVSPRIKKKEGRDFDSF